MEHIYKYQEQLFKKELLEKKVGDLSANSDLLKIRRNFQNGKKVLAGIQEKVKSLKKDEALKNDELGLIDEQLDALETQIYDGSVTNPREISMLQNKVMELRRKAENTSMQMGKITEARGNEEENAQVCTDKLKALQKSFTTSQDELKSHHTSLNKEISQCEKELKSLNKKIKKSEMTFFMDNRDYHGGKVYAMIIKGNTCNVCYRSVTNPTLERLKRGKEMCCDNCNRVLIWEEETPCENQEKQL